MGETVIFLWFLMFGSLVLTALSEKILLPKLSAKAEQPIYLDGPSWHEKKVGTPTMGGLGFFPAAILFGGICILGLFLRGDKSSALSFLSVLLFATANGACGLVDDLSKIRKSQNQGLTPWQKIAIQFLIAVLFLVFRAFVLQDGTAVPLFGASINLGIFYYLLAVFILLGTVNCANLTDGIDGLAASVAFAVGVSFFVVGGTANTALSLLSVLMMGTAIGFLFYNLHPAKVFMGDTGSLFLGGLAAGCAFCFGSPLIIAPIGIVYLIEGLSVILQVAFFKMTKRRLFLMAPLHHTLEKRGHSENRICLYAVFLTLTAAVATSILR